MPLYLGLDSSTQSLSAIVIEASGDTRRVVFESTLPFDEDFPEYGTQNGVLPNDPPDPFIAHSPPGLWAAALDKMMERVSRNIDTSDLQAISGSGQQHGSVYLRSRAADRLRSLDPGRGLAEQLGDVFARPTAPIWMDSSTAAQCAEITAAIGSAQELAALTGSRAFERFTGPQIRKFFQTETAAYEETDRIHLVSSFVASLLAGVHAPIDPGDGAGMNLMDLRRKDWAPAALNATAPELGRRLPPVRESSTIVGPLSDYWIRRHGFSPDVKVVTFSGDNPCSLIGVGLVTPGKIAISLGTSDTLFGYLPEPRVDSGGRGHVFGAPTGDYMSLICFLNGSLARERVRDDYKLDWHGFSEILRMTTPGNNGMVLLPWFEPEITPHVERPGARRFGGLRSANVAGNVRGVVEAQMMAMANHSDWMGVDIRTVHATGGAAANTEILQVMADVLDAEVFRLEVGNSAALGAALRALQADQANRGENPAWEDVIDGFVSPRSEDRVTPRAGATATYKRLRRVHAECERRALADL